MLSALLRTHLLGVLLLATAAQANDTYQITTPGKPGTDGVVPLLTGSGTGAPGAPSAKQLRNAYPNSPVVVVLGLSEVAAPFKGGILGPAPDFLLFPFSTDANGELDIPFTLPADAPPGFAFWDQIWVDDPGAFLGRSASNTLKFTVQESFEASAPPIFPIPRTPTIPVAATVDLADLNNDGFLDVVQCGGVAISISLGVGDGSFCRQTVYEVADDIDVMAIGDLDGDGVLDLASGSSDFPAQPIWTLRGRGDGSFEPGVSNASSVVLRQSRILTLGASGEAAFVGLSESDGVAQKLVVRPSLANGSLGPETIYTLPQNQLSASFGNLEVADFDADGLLDLVVSKRDSLQVFEGTATLAFATGANVPVGFGIAGLSTGDFDEDGSADLALRTGGFFFDPLSVLVSFGAGDGSFGRLAELESTDPNISGTSPPQPIDTADLDGDQHLDLVTRAPEGLAQYLGDGTGGFTLATDRIRGPSSLVALGDLDADGNVDIVSKWANPISSDGFDVTLSQGAGLFNDIEALSLSAENSRPGAGVAGDFDGDGRLDLAVVALPNTMTSTPKVAILRNTGTGSPELLSTVETSDNAQDLAVADVDNDGELDLVTLIADSAALTIVETRLGRGDGTFDPPMFIIPGTPLDGTRVLLEDMDLDGQVDLLVLLTNLGAASLFVYPGQGDGSFGTELRTTLPSSVRGFSVARVDADAIPDVVLALNSDPGACGNSGSVFVLPGTGDLGFATPLFDCLKAGAVGDPLVVDLDGDGAMEIVIGDDDPNSASSLGRIAIYTVGLDGAPGQPVLILPTGGSDALYPQAVDFDLDGQLDLVFESGAGLVVRRGEGGLAFSPPERFTLRPEGAQPGGPSFYMDLDADGLIDVLLPTTLNLSAPLNERRIRWMSNQLSAP